jgi:hypothetical protein
MMPVKPIYELKSYSPFYKTLPNPSLQMRWIPVRIYEMGIIFKPSFSKMPQKNIG